MKDLLGDEKVDFVNCSCLVVVSLWSECVCTQNKNKDCDKVALTGGNLLMHLVSSIYNIS